MNAKKLIATVGTLLALAVGTAFAGPIDTIEDAGHDAVSTASDSARTGLDRAGSTVANVQRARARTVANVKTLAGMGTDTAQDRLERANGSVITTQGQVDSTRTGLDTTVSNSSDDAKATAIRGLRTGTYVTTQVVGVTQRSADATQNYAQGTAAPAVARTEAAQDEATSEHQARTRLGTASVDVDDTASADGRPEQDADYSANVDNGDADVTVATDQVQISFN